MRPRRRRPRQGGFTLIELMISVVVGSLLMGFVLGISTRMSAAFKQQNATGDLGQALRAARETIAADLRQAGYRITRFRTATGAFGSTTADDLGPLRIVNGAGGGPDVLYLYYGDARAHAVVQAMAADREAVEVDDAASFDVGDLVLLSARSVIDAGVARVAEYDGCVARVTAVDATSLELSGSAAPYNAPHNPHCEVVEAAIGGDTVAVTRFVARGYRVDPERAEVGVLQQSPSGGLVGGDWTDLGAGFTDLQLASRYLERGDGADLDDDGDPERDWYAGDAQHTPDATGTRPAGAVLVQVSVGLAGRMDRSNGPPSTEAPAFIDEDNVEHNPWGDAPAAEVSGQHVYRSTRAVVDLRNIGAGR